MTYRNHLPLLRYDKGCPRPAGPGDWGRNGSVGRQASPPAASSEIVGPAHREGPEEAGLTLLPPLPYRSVMVPLDGSPFGEHALPLALAIARRGEARLLLVHVASTLHAAHSLDLALHSACYARHKLQQQDYLGGVVRRLEDVSPVPVTPILLEDEAVTRSLADMAGAGADLVVMATHGRGPFARFWRGSVADALVRQLSIPVVMLRGSREAPDLMARPAVRRVLVPLDGSRFSERVLCSIAAWGAFTGAEYTLLHAVDPARAPGPGPLDGTGAIQRHLRQLPREARHFMRTVELLAGRGPRVNACVRFEKDPARAILRHAQTHGSDLIALATWGRGGLSRLLRGSVTDRVIRGASVPVFVFRPQG